jgi:hypothetical protein
MRQPTVQKQNAAFFFELHFIVRRRNVQEVGVCVCRYGEVESMNSTDTTTSDYT